MSGNVEREILWTGIGGQGVQLAARVLALAATEEGREVMWIGTYGGNMRGGNTDANVVIADGPIVAPPLVSRAWGAVVVHPRFFEPMVPKLTGESFVFVDEDLVEEPLPDTIGKITPIHATTLAREADAPKAASLVLLGAFANATGIVSPSSLESALASALPSYRQQFLEANRRALAVGFDAVPALSAPAWTSEAA
jgi:Pyruvate/2-oxoacid:ferredoxin oxidoreductase gamma subunit